MDRRGHAPNLSSDDLVRGYEPVPVFDRKRCIVVFGSKERSVTIGYGELPNVRLEIVDVDKGFVGALCVRQTTECFTCRCRFYRDQRRLDAEIR